MLYYDRIDESEVTDVNKTRDSKECDICHYWYCYFYWYCDIAILNIKSADCCCVISRISKSEAINLMQSTDLTKKAEHYKT